MGFGIGDIADAVSDIAENLAPVAAMANPALGAAVGTVGAAVEAVSDGDLSVGEIADIAKEAVQAFTPYGGMLGAYVHSSA